MWKCRQRTIRLELVGYADGYYLTATNRTEAGMEFLVRFRNASFLSEVPAYPDERLMVYDWSCLPAYPCENGSPNVPGKNNFVKDWRLADYPCWFNNYADNTDHWVNYIYYRNSSWILEPRNPPADPPLWRNAATIWNFCTQQYDGIYSHDFAFNQQDCSVTHLCGGWAGIAERFKAGGGGGKPPEVLKVGFHHQNLEYDGQSAGLGPSNSYFIDPSVTQPAWQSYSPWAAYGTWEAGTYQDDDADGIRNDTDPDIDGDGVLNIAEAPCGATWPWGATLPEWTPDSIPERLGGFYTGRDDDLDGAVDEALPAGTGGFDCDNDRFSGNAEKLIFATASIVNDQYRCAETTIRFDETNDRWPLDLDDNRLINLQDVGMWSTYANSGGFGSVGPNPPYNPRYDFTADNLINLQDQGKFNASFGKTC